LIRPSIFFPDMLMISDHDTKPDGLGLVFCQDSGSLTTLKDNSYNWYDMSS